MASLGSGQVLVLLASSALRYSFVVGWLADVVVVPSLLPSILTEASSTFMCLCVSVGE